MSFFKRKLPPAFTTIVVSRRTLLEGATVIAFRADGCMANDEKFLWIGVVTGFEAANIYNGSAKGQDGYYAIIDIQKSATHQGDIRDGFIAHERVWIDDGALQHIGHGVNLWTYIK